jgi:hypothetical protein
VSLDCDFSFFFSVSLFFTLSRAERERRVGVWSSCSKMRSEAVSGGPWAGGVGAHVWERRVMGRTRGSLARLAPNWEEAQLEASHTVLLHRYDGPLKWKKNSLTE